MKILHLCPYLYPAVTFGGPARVVYDVAKEQSKHHQVTVVTSDAFNESRRMVKADWASSTDTFQVVYLPNWWYHHVFSQKIFTHFGLVVWFWHHGKSFDVVHLHDIFILPQLLSAWLAIWFGIPLYISPHGVLDPIRMAEKPFLKQLLYQTMVRPIIDRATMLVSTSGYPLESISHVTKTPIGVVPNGVEIPPITLRKVASKNDFVTIAYLGRLHKQKGLLELLEAVASLKSSSETGKTPAFTVLIAGPDDNLLPQLEAYIQKENLSSIVKLVGPVAGDSKAKLLEQADIFIYPSHSEGFSISILEAMSSSLPVIITTGCNFPEVATRKAGIVVSLDSLVPELASAMQQLLQSPQLRFQMGKNARELVEAGYSIETMAKKLVTLYENK